MLKNGLYEQVINDLLDKKLAENSDRFCQTAAIDEAQASKILAKYVAEIIEKGLDNVRDNGGDLQGQIALINRIIAAIKSETQEDSFDELTVAQRAEQLLALFDKKDSSLAVNEKAGVVVPKLPLRKARFLRVQSTSRRCLASSKKKLFHATKQICLCRS